MNNPPNPIFHPGDITFEPISVEDESFTDHYRYIFNITDSNYEYYQYNLYNQYTDETFEYDVRKFEPNEELYTDFFEEE